MDTMTHVYEVMLRWKGSSIYSLGPMFSTLQKAEDFAKIALEDREVAATRIETHELDNPPELP